MKPRITAVLLAAAAAVAVVALTYGAAGAGQHGAPPPTAAAPAGMADMMKQHQQMMADMKKADGELTVLVAKMNAATGNEKVDATAVVVTELARRQALMHERMGQMMMMMGGRTPQSGGTDQHQH